MRRACGELEGCDDFVRLLQEVLQTGNRLNEGTMRGAAAGASAHPDCDRSLRLNLLGKSCSGPPHCLMELPNAAAKAAPHGIAGRLKT